MGYVQNFYAQNTVASDFSGPVTLAADTSACDLLLICGRWENPTAPTVDDNKGNTWTPVGTPVAGRQVGIWWCQHPTVGAGHTFHMGGSWYMQIIVLGFAGSGVAPKDQHLGVITANDPITLGPITPTANGELVVSVIMAAGNGATTTASAPFIVMTGDKHLSMATAYAIQATAAPISVTMSSSPGTGVPGLIASFKGVAVQTASVLTLTPCDQVTVGTLSAQGGLVQTVTPCGDVD